MKVMSLIAQLKKPPPSAEIIIAPREGYITAKKTILNVAYRLPFDDLWIFSEQEQTLRTTNPALADMLERKFVIVIT